GYTQFMRNRRLSHYPMVPLFLGVKPDDSAVQNAARVQFFPEGGHLVEGAAQNVGVYVCDNALRPMQTDYCIMANNTDTIARGHTNKSGLASFSLNPQPGVSYIFRTPQTDQGFEMPQTAQSPTIQALQSKGRLICRVLGDAAPDSHLMVYSSDYGLKELTVNNGMALADVDGSAPGVYTLWLTDGSYVPVAERSIWVGETPAAEQQEFELIGGKAMDDVFSVKTGSLIEGSHVFTRVVPEWDTQSQGAFEMLNLSSQLSSAVPFPKGYHESSATDSRHDLNNWMLSAQQVLYPTEFLRADSLSYPYAVEAAFSMSGEVKQNRAPLKNALVQIFNTTTNDATTAVTDEKGHFETTVGDFADGSKFFIQANDKNGRPGHFVYTIDEHVAPAVVRNFAASQMAGESYGDSIRRYKLDEVLVKGTQINRKEELAKLSRTTDFLDRTVLTKHNVQTIKEALLYTGKVLISSDNNNIKWKNVARYISMGGGGGMNVPSLPGANSPDDRNKAKYPEGETVRFTTSQIPLVIDGILYDRDLADFLGWPTTDIESIELVDSKDSRSLWHKTYYGFIDIKTRSGMKTKDISADGLSFKPKGLAVPTKDLEQRMPSRPGNYRVIVDVVSPDRSIKTYVKKIELQ
ncbi:MAG: hypothetical protein MJZ73_00005, partial [Bacteroidaceae bacterium]|nr:hypothetical protein [Bacteroidaceae bacterium]